MHVHLSLLHDRFGYDAWTSLTPRQKGLVRRDVESMLADSGLACWKRGDSTTFSECAALLHDRIGGSRNLVSYARCLEASARRRASA